jgi:predicted enzyme related to lactoylglutathione lyase
MGDVQDPYRATTGMGGNSTPTTLGNLRGEYVYGTASVGSGVRRNRDQGGVMPEKTEYAPGTPSWVDIGTDVEPAKAFYSSLFKWDCQDAGPPEETGGYGFFLRNGKMVAGYGPQQNPGPPFWSTYVSVSDADATAKEAEAAGGTVVMAPMDVMDAGRMAVFQDPQGAFISAWQPSGHKGAQLVNEPGTLCWNELNSRDP